MTILIIGLILFFGIHSVQIFSPDIRSKIVDSRGEGAWMWPYTAIATIGLILVIYGYGLARQAPYWLYAPPAGLRHASLLLMLPMFPLLFATYFPGRIKAVVRHPMLIATMLWGLAHLLANGGLHDVLLFGGFLVWAALDLISLLRRPARPIRTLKPARINDAISVIAGLLVYALLLAGLHRLAFGVAPI